MAETLQLSAVVVAFDSLKRMDKSIKVRASKLTVLLPFHGAGIGSHARNPNLVVNKLRLIPRKQYSESLKIGEENL